MPPESRKSFRLDDHRSLARLVEWYWMEVSLMVQTLFDTDGQTLRCHPCEGSCYGPNDEIMDL